MKKTILTIVLAIFAITMFAQNEDPEIRVPNGYQGFWKKATAGISTRTCPQPSSCRPHTVFISTTASMQALASAWNSIPTIS